MSQRGKGVLVRPRNVSRAVKRGMSTMRSFTMGGRPEVIPGIVTERLEDGRYRFKRDDWPITITLPVTPPGAIIPTPRRMSAYTENGSVQAMALRWRGASGVGGAIPTTPKLSWWLRRFARPVGKYFPDVPAGTRLLLGAPTPTEDREDGQVLRAWGNDPVVLARALNHTIVQGESIVEVGGEGLSVIAIWETGGVKFAMTEGSSDSVGPDYEAGWTVGFADAETVSGPLGLAGDAAQFAWDNSLGLDPLIGWPYEDGIPLPPYSGVSEEWVDGWKAGLWAGWIALWEEAWMAAEGG